MAQGEAPAKNSDALDSDPDHYRTIITCGPEETEQMILDRIRNGPSPSEWAICIDSKRRIIGIGGIPHTDIRAANHIPRESYFAGIVSLNSDSTTVDISVLLDRRDPRGIVEDRRTGTKHETGVAIGKLPKFEEFKSAIERAIQFQLLKRG